MCHVYVLITTCDKFIRHAVNTAAFFTHADGLCSIFWTRFPDNLRTADLSIFECFQKNNTLDYVLYSIGFNGIQTKSMFLWLINFKRVINVEQFFFVSPHQLALIW